mmetsp:Transcript_75165/g.178634  ORF Transcript_75165/g.178634 Transcript_75165/m.178634 type:complete len:636 (+) Transcript_75165:175-2082(+)
MSAAEDDLAMALALSQAKNVEVMERASALLSLPKDKQGAAIKTVTTLLENLVKDPENAKFRSVRLSNAKIKAAIVDVQEAMQLMLACGFAQQEDNLVAGDGAEAKAAEALGILRDATAVYQLSRELAHGSAVRCLCSLPDGSLVTGAMDNIVRHFQAAEGSAPVCFVGHARTAGVDGVLAVCPRARGLEVASGGRDGKVIIWDVATGQMKQELLGHGEGSDVTNGRSIGALTCAADDTIISGGWDKTVRVWAEPPRVLSEHSVAVNGVCTLAEGEIVSASGDGTLRVWSASATSSSSFTCNAASPARAVCSVGSSGVAFASAHNDGHVRTWNKGGNQLKKASASTSYLYSVAHCSRRELLATGGDDGVVMLWTVDLELVQTLQHPMEVRCVGFLDSGDLLTGCEDQAVRVWTRDSNRAAPAHILKDYEAKVAAVMAAAATSMDTSRPASSTAGGPWDFEYPVELSGGKKMTLRWRRGEQAEAVANRFLSENGLPANHFPDVLAYVQQQQQQAGGAGLGGGGGGGAGQAAFSYPVEVADGRRLTISWNPGEDPTAVAQRFAREHAIPPAELQDIANFVAQVSGMPAPAAPAVAAPVTISAEVLNMMMQMGFDENRARAALQATGGNVEAAIQRLLG